MMEILRSSTHSNKTDKGKDKVVENPPPPASSDHQKQKVGTFFYRPFLSTILVPSLSIGKNNANSNGKQEIAQVPGGDDEEYRQHSEVGKDKVVENPPPPASSDHQKQKVGTFFIAPSCLRSWFHHCQLEKIMRTAMVNKRLHRYLVVMMKNTGSPLKLTRQFMFLVETTNYTKH
ncbi:uncharacterized protein LOC113349106 isoform X1 [Papaver somniferum]|uniref:uncharacterized protein LOC113349106 isoform X1 n=1 Tax=Papaver somniferum TaxID=3469 RepID=UPI000E6F536A|nr:uncharacterized protein LOC113349106 isoform X1 [Papaver somniferum]